MSIIKRGTSDSLIVVSSSVYVCNSCGHTEMAKDENGTKECPKCHCEMRLVSSSAETSN